MSLTQSKIRESAKKLKLGLIFYKIYHVPKGFIKKIFSQGVVNMFIDWQGRIDMEKAVESLQSLENSPTDAKTLDIHFLTGKKFWYQTCLCAYSMSQYSGDVKLRPVIYDDGSLQKRHQDKILDLFPAAKIVLKHEIEEYIDKYLPESKFPYLRERRLNYPNIRKLTDIHVNSQGWKLVLDSDMLFFRTPDVLLNWLKSPHEPCHMVDVETSYGYTYNLMASLAQAEITDRINVGICGLKSEDIDWEQLEYWCKTMIEQEGNSYFQEQALIAMLMAGKPCTVVSSSDYIVMPEKAEVIQPKAILHHYVADSKPWYFRYAWKQVLKKSYELAF